MSKMATEKRLIDADLADSRLADDNSCGEKFPISWFRSWLALQETVDTVELPCKIGDKVYRIDKGNYHSNRKPFVQELTVTEISWKKEKHGDKDLGFAIIADGIRYRFTSIGKSVFLTRKEAEAKMDGDGNG